MFQKAFGPFLQCVWGPVSCETSLSVLSQKLCILFSVLKLCGCSVQTDSPATDRVCTQVGVPLTTVKIIKAQWAVSSPGSEVRGKRPLAGLAPVPGEVGPSRVLVRGGLVANATSGHVCSHKEDFRQNLASAKPRKCLLTCRPESKTWWKMGLR